MYYIILLSHRVKSVCWPMNIHGDVNTTILVIENIPVHVPGMCCQYYYALHMFMLQLVVYVLHHPIYPVTVCGQKMLGQ